MKVKVFDIGQKSALMPYRYVTFKFKFSIEVTVRWKFRRDDRFEHILKIACRREHGP